MKLREPIYEAKLNKLAGVLLTLPNCSHQGHSCGNSLRCPTLPLRRD